MPDKDYEEILDQNVGEVRSSVQELDEPDYQRLLELEKQGKDRKTVKQFLESNIKEQEESEAEHDEAEEYEEEIVEEIEENTSSGLLGSFSPAQLAVGGTALGLVIGLLIGFGAAGMPGAADGQVSQTEARDTVQGLFDATGGDAAVEVTSQNGMYYANITTEQEVNGTVQESSQTFYVSPDAELLFPEVQSPLMQTPINIEETMAQLEQQAQQPQTGNTTPQ